MTEAATPDSTDHTQPDQDALRARVEADRSSALPAFIFLSCAVVWLVLASFAGLASSLKLHNPDWLTNTPWLTFGRIRTLHLNVVAYGWRLQFSGEIPLAVGIDKGLLVDPANPLDGANVEGILR
ncbi:MAG: hypothetical protein ACMV0J_02690, partial [Fluviibacter sp.]